MKIGIIGGGASGSMAAYLLASSGLEVDIFEKSDKMLKKVRASGNGRCNLTNEKIGRDFYTGKEKEKIEGLLSEFGYERIKDFFEKRGLLLKSLESGRVYPRTLRADTVADFFEDLLDLEQVRLIKEKEIVQIVQEEGKGKKLFSLISSDNEKFSGYDRLVLAAGGAYGLSSKDWSNGYSLAKNLGHGLSPLHPGIVSLTVKDEQYLDILKGVKIRAGLSFMGRRAVDDLLFTEYGLSGSLIFLFSNSILDILKDKGQVIIDLDLLPDYDKKYIYESMKKAMEISPQMGAQALLSLYLGREGGQVIIKRADLESHKPLTDKEIEKVIDLIKSWTFEIKGTRKKDRGQVTCGGLVLEDMDPLHLESKKIKGLYICGEILNVQGVCGGYNLHWAWASAAKVSESIIEGLRDEGYKLKAFCRLF